LIISGPVNGKEGSKGTSEVVEVVSGSANSFEAVHDAALGLAGLDSERESEHEFDDNEKFINSVNGADFEGSITLGNVITSKKERWVVVEEGVELRNIGSDGFIRGLGVFGEKNKVKGGT